MQLQEVVLTFYLLKTAKFHVLGNVVTHYRNIIHVSMIESALDKYQLPTSGQPASQPANQPMIAPINCIDKISHTLYTIQKGSF